MILHELYLAVSMDPNTCIPKFNGNEKHLKKKKKFGWSDSSFYAENCLKE